MVQHRPECTCSAPRHSCRFLAELLHFQVDFNPCIFSLPLATFLPQLQMNVCVQLKEKHLSQLHKNKWCQPAAELVRKFCWGQKLFWSCHHAVFSNPTCARGWLYYPTNCVQGQGNWWWHPSPWNSHRALKKCNGKNHCLLLDSWALLMLKENIAHLSHFCLVMVEVQTKQVVWPVLLPRQVKGVFWVGCQTLAVWKQLFFWFS